MDFCPNKTPIEIIKEGHLVVHILETFILVLMKNETKTHGKNLFIINAKFYASYYDVNVNKYVVKTGASLRFWENKGWINKLDPYDWFQWYLRYWLGRRSKDDKIQINRWVKIVSR